MQNVAYIDDPIRLLDLTSTVKLVDLPTEGDEGKLRRAIGNSVFYDFMNDQFIKGDNLPASNVFVIKNSLFGKVFKTLPSNSLVILKGLGKNEQGIVTGGELAPVIGTPSSINLIIRAIQDAQAYASGSSTYKRYNIMNDLTEKQKQDIQTRLNGPIYQNLTIKGILESYKRQVPVPSDFEKKYEKIKKQLQKVIPEEKAINVASGVQVNAVTRCYHIEELQVTTDTNETKVVKFAFKTDLKPEEYDAYKNMLKDRFKAQEVQTTQPSIEQRRAVGIQPVRATSELYGKVFTSMDFQTYIRKLNETTQAQIVDTSQILHTEAPSIEEEEEYPEEYEEGDLGEY